jgi:hypothetical protein
MGSAIGFNTDRTSHVYSRDVITINQITGSEIEMAAIPNSIDPIKTATIAKTHENQAPQIPQQ